MTKGRLEAFSDGVIAIIITIMVLELRPPHEATLAALVPLAPVFLSYVLSFVFVGIYWSNHHHTFQAAKGVSGGILWANLHLLFWLSLVPFGTAWMGETNFDSVPVAAYGAVLFMAALAYAILVRSLAKNDGPDSPVSRAVGFDVKGKASLVVYALAIPLAFVSAWVAFGLYVAVAIMWLVPDRRMEKALAGTASEATHSSDTGGE